MGRVEDRVPTVAILFSRAALTLRYVSHANLFFIAVVEMGDNELLVLELIRRYVVLLGNNLCVLFVASLSFALFLLCFLDRYFGNVRARFLIDRKSILLHCRFQVCELDIVFNPHRVSVV